MRSALKAHALAVAALAAAVLLRWVIDPWLGDGLPFVTLFGAVGAAVWVGGYRPAIVVTLLGYFAVALLFIAPRGTVAFDRPGLVVGLVTYLFTCALIIAIGQTMRKAEDRARQRQETLRLTLRSIGDAVVTTDNVGRVTHLNAVAEALTGWPSEEAIGQPLDAVFRIVNEDTRATVESPTLRALREGAVVGLANHTLLIHRDGSERAIDDSAAPIQDDRGGISGCILIFRDVTVQREQAKERASQLITARVLASIVENSDDAIISKSLQGTIQSWNAAAERVFGYTAEEAIGRHISLIIPPERLSEEDEIIANLKAGRRIDHFETERVSRSGQRIQISLTVSPIKDADGRVVGASKIARDITRQRQAEEREQWLAADAAAAGAKFRAVFEQQALFAGIVDLDGFVREPNRRSWEGCGYTREQVVGKPMWEGPWWSASPEVARRIRQACARAVEGHLFRDEVPYVVGDGSLRVADLSIQPVRDDGGQVLFLAYTGSDITDRKRAEEDRQKFVTLVESSTDFIGMSDLDGIPFFVNRSGLAMVGLDDIEQARRTPVRDFFFPEDQARIMDEFFPRVLEKGHGELEVRFRHFKTGQARWMAYKLLTLSDPAGRLVALATVSQDITERKTMEDNLRRLAADLSEADRRKDEFLAMLAHELRSPLAPISNAVHLLRAGSGNGGSVQKATEMLERQVGQMGRLVDDLLDMGRITRGRIELRRERIELAPVLNQAIESARVLYRAMGHELTVTVPMEPIYLEADAARLAQVVGNLLNNACKFTDKGGHVWLTVEREEPFIVIRVRDNGIGIAPDQLPRLFGMFAQVDTSLERSRDGLGIGLTLVKTLVEMHGGSVEARSEGLGRGSEFVVRLPLVEVAMPKAPEPAPAVKPAQGRRILIVDDNEDGAESLAMMLTLQGHEVQTAHDGLAALEAAERFRPQVVLLDIGLPKLNGYEVCRRIRALPWGRDLTVVAVTGWGQDEDRQKSKEAGFDTHVVKPIDPSLLVRLLAPVEPGATPAG